MNSQNPETPNTQAPPVEDPRPGVSERERTESVMVLYTGDGKGKSSSAFGVMLRAVARDWQVAVIQFLKSDDWSTGEEKIGKQLGVHWWTLGEGFTWDSQNLSKDEATAKQAWQQAREILLSGKYQLVILDEITYPLNWGWIDEAEVIDALSDRSSKVNVVATGRDAPASLMEIADTVTDMQKVKHIYDTGVMAKAGLDY